MPGSYKRTKKTVVTVLPLPFEWSTKIWKSELRDLKIIETILTTVPLKLARLQGERKKQQQQFYLKTFIEKINSGNLIM